MGVDERADGKAPKALLDPRATLEAEAAAAAAADEEALGVDTTLDAVQQAIADQRRDDAPAATLMLAPISVVGVAGVVVIAILLVRQLGPARRAAGRRRRRRFDPRRERVSARRVPTRRSRDVEAGESAADALVKTSNANLRALFGGVGGGESNVGRSIFATPSETDAESAAETETSLRKGPGSVVAGFETGKDGNPFASNATGAWSNGEWSNGGLLAAWNRARAALDSAERFSSSRPLGAARVRAKDARRPDAGGGGPRSYASRGAAGERATAAASPAAEVRSPASASPRGDPPASVLDVAGEVSEVAGAVLGGGDAQIGAGGDKKPRTALADRREKSFSDVRRWAVFRRPPSPTRCRRPGRWSIERAGAAPGRAAASPTSTATPRRAAALPASGGDERARARLLRFECSSPLSPRAVAKAPARRTSGGAR